ncbi:zinc finger domain-containing protein [Streptomyces sp. WMMC897]|uniref:zinc finger domain-containing protein n=1 Tax=Streptomyces sp. WMMC897 TaxID=3014782 RepID=UPI0022B654F4|nr:hypothetical protein [Streptomyces sp. WMMC897]MCZ7413120.1 hypothetical protein [Streptomyces sp. WMMC897]MCZ7415496.1 hypothetical protein [Streptomyces sp. WMMC897]
MNNQETATLCRYVRALCPQQKFDEYTPDAWHDVLRNLQLADCREAAARVARRQPFVAPAEIVDEVRVLHDERLAGFVYEPPPGDSDPNYLDNLRQQRAAVAAGHRPPVVDRPALPAGKPFDEVLKDAGSPIGHAIPAEEREKPTGSPTAVVCPTCRARIGQPCKAAGRVRRAPHGARRRAAVGEPRYNPAADARAEQLRAASAAALQHLTPEQRAQLAATREAS